MPACPETYSLRHGLGGRSLGLTRTNRPMKKQPKKVPIWDRIQYGTVYASNFYKGALRHENMSWFWIRFSVYLIHWVAST
jgi:hypothetical protein